MLTQSLRVSCKWSIMFALILGGTGCQIVASRNPSPTQICYLDRDKALSLDEAAFDQDVVNSGGWRELDRPGCEYHAANIIRDYRNKHSDSSSILLWHEGQMRAKAGNYKAAIRLIRRTKKPPAADYFGWNSYVDATEQFLRRDYAKLVIFRNQLAATTYISQEGMPSALVDGMLKIKGSDGNVTTIPWPPNLNVVDSLIRCFNEPYARALSKVCK